jgi:hypothetical protein
LKASINRSELISWLQSQSDERIEISINESKNGNIYAEVDNWR